MKRLLPAAAMAVLCGCGVPTGPVTPAPAVSVAPSATQAPACDPGLWAHVYHPDRLRIIDPCRTITGTVDSVRYEPDGDTHIRLHITNPALVNQANLEHQHGDLVLEQVCAGAVTQQDAVDACQGMPRGQPVPHVGDHVSVTGVYVLDQSHGWLELHPVTSWAVIHG